MKKSLIFSLFVLLFPLSVLGLVKPTEQFYVNDYANIIDSEVEEYIMSRSVSLASKTGAQIVIVTVPSLEGENLEKYATDLFRSFGIGDKEKNNGLLLLLALEERQFRVEVGYGLEGVLPDGLTGRYQDQYIIPYLKNNDWNNGIKNGYTAFYKKLCEYYEIDVLDDTLDINISSDYNNYDSEYEEKAYIVFTALWFFIIVGFAMGRYCRKVSKKKRMKISGLYKIISLLIVVFSIAMTVFYTTGWIIVIIATIISWLVGRFTSESSGGHSSGRFSSGGGGWSSGGGGFSGGGFSGGGGSSGGSGSSRGF